MIALLIFGLFLVAMGVITIRKRRKNEKIFMASLAELGLAPWDLIPIGDFIRERPTSGSSFRDMFVVALGEYILIGVRDAVTNKFKTMERILKTNLIAVEVAGYSYPGSDNPDYFLTIRYNNIDMGPLVFLLRGSDAAERAERCREYLSNYIG